MQENKNLSLLHAICLARLLCEAAEVPDACMARAVLGLRLQANTPALRPSIS